MFALAAAIVFALGFLATLLGVTVPARISLVFLGLTLLALHFAIGTRFPLGRRRG